MNEKCTTDKDNGRHMAERYKEQPVARTAANVCDVNGFILNRKRAKHTF